jgi:hypothetical protein
VRTSDRLRHWATVAIVTPQSATTCVCSTTEYSALQRISPGNPVDYTDLDRAPLRRTQHRRGPRWARASACRARPELTPTRNPASLAQRAPHHLKPKPSNTHTHNVCQMQFECLEITEAATQIRLQTDCPENRRAVKAVRNTASCSSYRCASTGVLLGRRLHLANTRRASAVPSSTTSG